MTSPQLSLADGIRLARLSSDQLWTRYLALGGDSTIDQLRTHIETGTCPDHHDHDVIAQALNEVFLELGHDHPVAYHHR